MIYFIHIPKCSGTTFQNILKENFNYYRISEYKYPWGNWQKQKYKTDGIGGHFYFKSIPELPGSPGPVFTFLREPIARTISLFHFTHPDPEPGRNIIEWLDIPNTHYKNNCITRFFSLDYYADKNRPLTENDYETAVNNLEECNVGITEMFDESVLNFRFRYSKIFWRDTGYIETANVGKYNRNKKLTNQELDAVKHHNRFDMRLYLRAVDLFWEQKKIAKKAKELAVWMRENLRR